MLNHFVSKASLKSKYVFLDNGSIIDKYEYDQVRPSTTKYDHVRACTSMCDNLEPNMNQYE